MSNRSRWFLLLALLAMALPLTAAQTAYEKLREEAEKLWTEKSFALAHDRYLEAAKLELPPADKRWVQFRVADTLWRSQAATATSDPTKLDNARQGLEALVRDVQREEERDRLWVEVHQSLGDFYWTSRQQRNWGQAWPYYQKALDWWAGAADIDLARKRYVEIVRTIASPPAADSYYHYGYYGNYVPLEILENYLKIVQDDGDRAHAHYLIAMTLRNQGGTWPQRARIPEEFEAALSTGKKTDWYDDALFNYAQWMEQGGRISFTKDGQWQQQPDYVKALELYRRVVKDFVKGETRYFDQSQERIKEITRAVINVSVQNVFLPQSKIQFHLNWRNVKTVQLTLYPIDLVKDVELRGENVTSGQWLEQIDLTGREELKSWSRPLEDKGDHKPGSELVRLDQELPKGAYLLVAQAANASSREIVLVTDATVVLKTSGQEALVYYCNALDGSPIGGAQVKLSERYYDGSRWQWRQSTKEANAEGLALFDLRRDRRYHAEIFVTARATDRQAFSPGHSYQTSDNTAGWRFYAFTDRPAYRPGEEVQWKFVARRYNGSVYATPAQARIEYQIDDARGTKVKDGQITLNDFGSGWGSVTLTEAMPLGEFRIRFFDEKRAKNLGQATLFRLEEYKLPEFKVSVRTPEENGKRKTFRLGEKVEVRIEANYYFGGPVADANVEVMVYQNPYYHYWNEPREFPWYYDQTTRRPSYRGDGQLLKRETLRTDATGAATLTFETPENAGQDFEYRIEARVTDASRREIVGSDTVRVTQQRYYVQARAEHNLYRPQDKVAINFRAADANNEPVQAEGIVKVTRDFWFEIWVDPNGRELKGDELKAARQKHTIFPPPPAKPGDAAWRLKFRGYEHDDILTRTLKTTTNGTAELTFTPERDGYYRVTWSSEDAGGKPGLPTVPVTTETTVWVASGNTTELGYRAGGVQIIVDKDTVRTGENAPVMLVVPTNDRYVLFSVEGENLQSYQLVHLTGTVKLVPLPIEEKHTPNVFLSAAMVSDRQLYMDTKEVIVPPVKQFLQVRVEPDHSQYEPRSEGTFTVTTSDHEGKAISAEVALGVVDESVYYVQQDYAGDPRQFFYGTKRTHQTQTQSTFNQKAYAKLVLGEKDALVEEWQLGLREEEAENESRFVEFDGNGRYRNRQSKDILSKAKATRLAGIGGAQLDAKRSMMELSASGALSDDAVFTDKLERKSPMNASAPGQKSAEEPADTVTVRSDFRSTIFWQPDVVTDKEGRATVKVRYPDSLTTWKTTVRAATGANQFGITLTNTQTKQPLIVRLQAPRFFVVGDLVTISALINNNTTNTLSITPALDVSGLVVKGIYREGKLGENATNILSVPAGGEARADWAVEVRAPGNARIRVTARAAALADAMEKTFLVHEHGIEKFLAKSGKARGDTITVALNLPRERKANATSMAVYLSPSIAVSMLDALPYLIGYPYGCTEQTMSRFLPAVVTAKTLRDLGLQPEDVMGRVFGGIETAFTNKTQPGGKRDLQQLNAMVKQGLDRLYSFQHGDGGWGWWKEGDSDHFMSAYVVWGLTLARQAGTEVKEGVLERGVDYLRKELVEEEVQFDQQAFMLHALAAYHAFQAAPQVGEFETRALENLWNNRERLNAYTRALLALSAHHYAQTDKAQALLRNLVNGVSIDKSPDTSIVIKGGQDTNANVMGTAHWGEDGIYYRWSEGGVEATAFALKAFLTIDPKNALVEPIMNWLVKNRRGAQWSNTRDTAIAVLCLNDYLRQSGELAPDLEYELLVNGQSIAIKKVQGADGLAAPTRFNIDSTLIRDNNEVRIVRKRGDGPIYFAAQATFFSMEEPITPAGNEIFVRRDYYKLVGRPTLLKGYVYAREPLLDGGEILSGDRVETILTVEAKNNYEYLVFEDLKPAGFEAVEVRSGQPLFARELKSGATERTFAAPTRQATAPDAPAAATMDDYTGRQRWVYQELRDRKVALFLDRLPQGTWQMRYDFRAEVPGKFHGLPVLGHAMYVPEIRCNSRETRVTVKDRGPSGGGPET